MTHYFVLGVLVFELITTGMLQPRDLNDLYIGKFFALAFLLAATICQAIEIWGK